MGGQDIEMRAMLGASIIGIAFGATHFIARNSEFPSHIEFLLWQISCIAITIVPLILASFCGGMEMKLQHKPWTKYITNVVAIFAPLILLLYLFSRITT